MNIHIVVIDRQVVGAFTNNNTARVLAERAVVKNEHTDALVLTFEVDTISNRPTEIYSVPNDKNFSPQR